MGQKDAESPTAALLGLTAGSPLCILTVLNVCVCLCVSVSHALCPPVFSCPIIFNPGRNVNRLNSVVLSLLCVFVRVCVSLVHMLDFLVPRSLALCQEAERRASRRRK